MPKRAAAKAKAPGSTIERERRRSHKKTAYQIKFAAAAKEASRMHAANPKVSFRAHMKTLLSKA